MLKRTLLVASVALSLFVIDGLQNAQADKEKGKTFKAACPVSGRPAKKSKSVEYKGKKVYFCCGNCPKAFKANTAKYADKANHQLAQTGQIVQVACPLTGRPINPETAIKVEGVSVAFCCGNCKGKAQKSDEPVALIFGDISKGYTVQTKCPVSGKPVNAKHSLKHDGQTVYFCCPKCPAAFKDNPDKYTGKLPQFKQDKS